MEFELARDDDRLIKTDKDKVIDIALDLNIDRHI